VLQIVFCVRLLNSHSETHSPRRLRLGRVLKKLLRHVLANHYGAPISSSDRSWRFEVDRIMHSIVHTSQKYIIANVDLTQLLRPTWTHFVFYWIYCSIAFRLPTVSQLVICR